MTRKELARAIAKQTKLNVRQAENLVISFGAVVEKALEQGKKIVYSNFGTFYTVHYPSKTINHPKYGGAKKMIMLPTNAVKWMPADNIKKLVNSGEVVEMPTMHKSKKIKDVDTHRSPTQITTDKRSENNETMKQPASPAGGSNNDSDDDDLEKYLAERGKKQEIKEPVNVYDELLKDGSHEFSTVKGSIKAHHDNDQKANKEETIEEHSGERTERKEAVGHGPFASIKEKLGFGKKEEEKDDKEDQEDDQSKEETDKHEEKISLAGAGIFGKESALATEPKHVSKGEQKINQIKGEVATGANPSMPPVKTEDDIKQKEEEIKAEIPHNKINIQYQDLSKVTVDKKLLSLIPENISRRYKAVPVEDKGDKVTVAMVDPEDIETKEIFKKLLGKDIDIVLATEEDINHILAQYQGLESEVSSAIATVEGKEEKDDGEKKKDDKQAKIEAASDDAPASKIVASLMKRAIRDKASDVHIEPTEAKVEVRFRLDGVLRPKVTLPKDIQAAVVSRIKILSNLKIDEQRVPQDGRFNMIVDGRKVDFRVSTMPVANGEKVVMRILDKEAGVLTMEQLGIEGSGKKIIEDNLTKNHGMILVTGPTGSGKTTTLYAMIGKIFNDGVNIVTLEDPIEYQIKGINQSQVNSEIGYNFANGLRSILRQDPDVIMLGEIRDKETAEMAVHAALTGHVVLSTLHTNDASGAIPRLIDMGVEPFLLTSSVNVVIGQRLARTICSDCKEETKLPETEVELIKKEIERMPAKEKEEISKKAFKFYKGKGCKTCDESGYHGRIGIYEVLGVSESIKDLTLKKVSASQIEQKAIEEGMLTMMQDGIKKALEGKTSMEEIWRVTKE